jgi:polyketide cyclase/dehydrase/lipid transport protein
MSTWSTRANVNGRPEDVIEVLTDPETIRRWSPIDFELEQLDGDRLEAGSQARVAGRLAGRSTAFDVDVSAAGDGRFALTASGPVDIEVEYEAFEADAGSEVWATVTVSGGGFVGRLLAQATDALLAAGALDKALGRIAREVDEFGYAEELALAA